jgi:hypothetical protein
MTTPDSHLCLCSGTLCTSPQGPSWPKSGGVPTRPNRRTFLAPVGNKSSEKVLLGSGENYDDRITQWLLLWKSQHFPAKFDDYGQQPDAISRLNGR